LLGVLNPIAVSLYPAIAVMVLFFSALFSLHFQWGENKLRVGAASALRAQSVSPYGKGDTPNTPSLFCLFSSGMGPCFSPFLYAFGYFGSTPLFAVSDSLDDQVVRESTHVVFCVGGL
jgi:hypothetical protein